MPLLSPPMETGEREVGGVEGGGTVIPESEEGEEYGDEDRTRPREDGL